MNRVLAVAAHPDDIEFLMAGTLIRLKDAGLEIHYWNLANGCYGSAKTDREETIRIREKESIESCKQLGATFHPSICDDLSVFYDRETLARVTSKIREIEPSIILDALVGGLYGGSHQHGATRRNRSVFTGDETLCGHTAPTVNSPKHLPLSRAAIFQI